MTDENGNHEGEVPQHAHDAQLQIDVEEIGNCAEQIPVVLVKKLRVVHLCAALEVADAKSKWNVARLLFFKHGEHQELGDARDVGKAILVVLHVPVRILLGLLDVHKHVFR